MARLGELPPPVAPLTRGGTLSVNPPVNLPPRGGAIAGTGEPGVFHTLGANQSVWQSVTFTADIAPKKIQDYILRKFLLIQNKSTIGTIYVGFGYIPNASNGLVLPPGISYEPFSYPVNEIYVTSDINGVSGLLIYGV